VEGIRQESSDLDTSDVDANQLIEKLRKQTEENREKNERDVQQRTFMNDQVCVSFVQWMNPCLAFSFLFILIICSY